MLIINGITFDIIDSKKNLIQVTTASGDIITYVDQSITDTKIYDIVREKLKLSGDYNITISRNAQSVIAICQKYLEFLTNLVNSRDLSAVINHNDRFRNYKETLDLYPVFNYIGKVDISNLCFPDCRVITHTKSDNVFYGGRRTQLIGNKMFKTRVRISSL